MRLESGGEPPLIRTPGELCATVAAHPSLRACAVGAQDEARVGLRLGEAELILLWPSVWRDASALEPERARAAARGSALVLVGADADFAGLLPTLRERGVLQAVVLPACADRLAVELQSAFENLDLRRRGAERKQTLDRYKYELQELLDTSRALASERDVRKLLAAILLNARQITGADAGSVYVVEGQAEDVRDRVLHFMLSQNDSVQIDLTEATLPIDGKSIVGAAVILRESINLPDLYALEFGTNPYGFQHDRSFDEKIGYQTRSMLTVPMRSARDEVIGVIQLINKKRDPKRKLAKDGDFESNVVPFDQGSAELAGALAAQAGVSLENALLYEEVRSLFEGFVHASVIAIESRDPTTSGHSQRVATLTVELARVVDRIDQGPLAPLKFGFDALKKIEYAGLLHDFGKVGVREKVLVKAKKLYDSDRQLILSRFDYIKKALEADHLRALSEAARASWPEREADLKARLHEIDRFVELILRANEPTVLPEGGFDALKELAARTYCTPGGEERPFLEPDELVTLSIPRGSLTDVERIEIESHVTHTYNFLRKIPWGRLYGDIPMIAGSHHEKLDGSGYPRHLPARAIPVEAKMMTISDIFDALTASDRPYKKAMAADKALAIIESEVKAGKCDPELFRVFVEAQVFKRVLSG